MKLLISIAYYSWLYLFLLMAAVVFPPLIVLFAVPPLLRWRRNRIYSSPEWREAREHARKVAWLESL